MPRALTAVQALRAAGVNVAAGADNLQDPFNPVGRGDPLETAGLMVMAAHLLPDEALATVTDTVALAIGLAPATIELGRRADLVAMRAATSARPSLPPGRDHAWSCARQRGRSVGRDGHRVSAETQRSHDRAEPVGRPRDRSMRPMDQHRQPARAPARRLAGRRAIITGGGRGIGAEIARTFRREGAELAAASTCSATSCTTSPRCGRRRRRRRSTSPTPTAAVAASPTAIDAARRRRRPRQQRRDPADGTAARASPSTTGT